MNVTNATLSSEDSTDWWDIGSLFQTILIDVGVFAILLYAAQYILSTYCCLSAGHQLLVKHLLPLQIYAEDARTIVETIENENPDVSDRVGNAKMNVNPMFRRQITTVSTSKATNKRIRLRKLINQYDELVLSDKYCHVKLISRTGEDCCCCFTLEDNDLCYVISRLFTCKCCCKTDTTERGSHYERFLYEKTRNSGVFHLKTKRWRNGRCLCFKRIFYCCFHRICGHNCCETLKIDHNVPVRVENIFFGAYEPLVPSRHDTMNPINVDEKAPKNSVRDVFDTNRQDAWHNFCGWWKTWALENLKNAFKAELDTQNLAKEFKIKF